MKSGTQVALAVGAGYLLGRRRKMRMALMLGGAALAGGLGGAPGQLLRRGAGVLGSTDVLGKLSPGLGEVTGMISDELLPVGKAAARAAVSSQIDALSDRVHERAEALRQAQEAGEEPEEEEEEEEEEERPSGRQRHGQRSGDENEDETGYGDGEATPLRSRRRRDGTDRPAGGNGQRSDRQTDREDEYEDRDEDEYEDEDMPVRAAGSRAGAPVRRVRR